MPKNRPGRIFYATATATHNHGAPVIYNNVPGVAVKQKAVSHTAALATHKEIASGEKFAIIAKGIVEIPTVAGAAKGDLVYINATTHAVSTTNTDVPFGRVVEVAGERGTPTGKQRVDLDLG